MQTDLLLQTAASAASYGNYISRYPAAYAIPYARDYAADPYHAAAAIGPAAAAYGVRYPSIARVKSQEFLSRFSFSHSVVVVNIIIDVSFAVPLVMSQRPLYTCRAQHRK